MGCGLYFWLLRHLDPNPYGAVIIGFVFARGMPLHRIEVLEILLHPQLTLLWVLVIVGVIMTEAVATQVCIKAWNFLGTKGG